MRCILTYSEIDTKIFEIFTLQNIRSFPLDCEEIAIQLGCLLYRYSELSKEKRSKCLMVSDESIKLHNRIYYNDTMSFAKIRFSIMHEIGHIVLGHGEYSNDNLEAQANYFSSHILAPRIAIHYSECKNYTHVAHKFGLSYEAAQYAFDDYRKWHRHAIYKMSTYDRLMYNHFYHNKFGGFVYSITNCHFCGEELFNTTQPHCSNCNKMFNYPTYHSRSNQHNQEFYVAESNWLYGGI